jgi:hypothetical protein
MQEIRDFIYGKRQLQSLSIMPAGKRKWKHFCFSNERDIYGVVAKELPSDTKCLISGVRCSTPGGELEEPLPYPVMVKIFEPKMQLWASCIGDTTTIYSVWGVTREQDTWDLLVNVKPTMDELRDITIHAPYDLVVVCKYSPRLTLIESCELVLRAKIEEPKTKPPSVRTPLVEKEVDGFIEGLC